MILCAPQAGAKKFFDSSSADNLFNIGVRFGINTSNRNIKGSVYDVWNNSAWGTGIDAGVVADINFRDWISIQPGFFYESRSGKYTYINVDDYDADGVPIDYVQYGRDRSYNFTVPILAAVHLNIADNIRWNLEFGPYLQFSLKNSVSGKFSYPVYSKPGSLPVDYLPVKSSKFDFGFKMGTSITMLNHYVVGVHYEAGVLNTWNESCLGGRRKAWVFSIGYDF